MTRTKTKIVAATVAGLLLSGAVTLLIRNQRAARAPYASSSDAPPFEFARHAAGDGGSNHSSSGADPSGLAGFTSDIPVIVLRSESPGPVSNSKAYSAFKLEIYEPGTNGPASFANVPTDWTYRSGSQWASSG